MAYELTIIQQNDTHGYIETHPEFFWGFEKPQYRMAGGFARIACYVNTVKRERANVLYVDGGDLFHGTGPAVLSQGNTIVELINAMKPDVFVPGNWDFAYGAVQLQSLAEKVNCPTIAVNVHKQNSKDPFFSPYTIKEFQGFNVGIIGLTYPYVDQTMPDSFSNGLSFSLGLEELQIQIETLRNKLKVDLIIVVSHMGLPLDVKLSSIVRGIDIILSGHSHDRLTAPIVKDGCMIIQSGSSGSFLGRLDVSIDNGKITGAAHQLIPLYAEDFPEDQEILEMIEDNLKPYNSMLAEEIGVLKSPLHRMTLNEAPMDRLITDAYLSFIDADVSFSHGWRYGVPVLPGKICLKQMYQIIPTNPQLFELEIEGARLLQSLENNLEQVFSVDPFQQKGGYVLRSSNLMMAYKPYNPYGHRIQHIEINGKPLDPKKTYRVVGASDQIFKKHQTNRKILQMKAHDVIKAYFSLKKEVAIDEKRFIYSI